MREAPRHDVPVADDHRPRRTCVGCHTTRPKSRLLRLAATPEGVRFDPDQQLPGRGAYVCPDPHCVDAVARRDGRAALRALRSPHSESLTTALDLARAHSTTAGGTQYEEHTA